ncbi:2-(3-amino-3-carboxypropyl)histidine synthase subunit 2-like isoform X2 [Procambarus clarkii]
MASFSNSGSEALARTLEEGILRAPTLDLEKMYEITRCVGWIQAGDYRKVALQFPDELLGDAGAVCRAITLQLGFTVYILGDTTYGSCCVDEVAAEHVGADAIIHFGRACLSPSRRLPVLCILTRIPVDIPAVISGLESAIEDRTRGLIFVYDTRCHYIASELVEKLQKIFPHLVTTTLLMNKGCSCNTSQFVHGKSPPETSCYVDSCCQNTLSPRPPASEECCRNITRSTPCECESSCQNRTPNNVTQDSSGRLTFLGRVAYMPSESDIRDYHFIYLGPSGPTVNSLLMRFSENTFYCVSSDDGSVEITSGVHIVMKRSANLEKAKDAKIIGILVGTLGVADCQHVISKLKSIIKAAGKRSYTFIVGKPNEPKLANISEVDTFVYVACPETSIIERNTDPVLYKKLITPWELEVALLPRQEWSLAFETDFRQLLPGGSRYIEVASEPREEEVNVSLITCKTQALGVRDTRDVVLDSSTGGVVLQDGHTIAAVHVGGGGQVLKGRTWQGLDPAHPSCGAIDSVAVGRSGIASLYKDENPVSQ